MSNGTARKLWRQQLFVQRFSGTVRNSLSYSRLRLVGAPQLGEMNGRRSAPTRHIRCQLRAHRIRWAVAPRDLVIGSGKDNVAHWIGPTVNQDPIRTTKTGSRRSPAKHLYGTFTILGGGTPAAYLYPTSAQFGSQSTQSRESSPTRMLWATACRSDSSWTNSRT